MFFFSKFSGFGLKEIIWRRVLDVNDRSLRSIVTGLGPSTNGITEESGFDITPVSYTHLLCTPWQTARFTP